MRCYDEKQGHAEPTGQAKITPAFNLPCKYVLHTVGPIVDGELTQTDCDLLASCYTSCLDLAQTAGISSIAFCCISTGVFRFPQEKAAEIAIATVKTGKKNELAMLRSDAAAAADSIKVVFTVFTEKMNIFTKGFYMTEAIEQLKQLLEETEPIVIGAGSGLSTSAGFTYSVSGLKILFRFCGKIRFSRYVFGWLYSFYVAKNVGHTGAAIL